jgi:2,3-bisphosphoglycerate-dependent phosphoglycerate mutase
LNALTLTELTLTDGIAVNRTLQNQRPLILMRHGATEPNLQGLRCGGDLDVPLAALGVTQVRRAAKALQALALPIDVIVASDLQRTLASARLVSDAFGGLPLIVEPALRERSLGQWNLQPAALHEDALARGETPPGGGESNDEFARRVTTAVALVRARVAAHRFPLVIGSKGVARVMLELLPLQSRGGVDARFDGPGALDPAQHRAPVCHADLLWFNFGVAQGMARARDDAQHTQPAAATGSSTRQKVSS